MKNSKVISGLIYKFLEKSGTQLINFVISIILARILLTDDFGVIALVTVLINFADIFVTYGFGNSLVVKKNAETVDYSSCLYASLLLSVIVYGIIFVSAPYVESFFGYEQYQLSLIIRVLGLRLPFAAFNSIQQAYILKHILFRKSFVAGTIASLISGIIGIWMAYHGYNAWALVAQYLIQSIINTVFTFAIVTWRPTLEFSMSSIKETLSFGWKVLLTGFLDTLYIEVRSLIIAKWYSSSDLAYYDKADRFPKLVINNINVSIISVLFPLMAKDNDNLDKVKKSARLSLNLCSFLLFPLLIGLAAVSKTLVLVLLTEKWISCAPYISIFCLGYIFLPINSINKNIMQAIGRSDILLKTDIIKKLIGISIILVTAQFGVLWIVIGFALYNFTAILVNIPPVSKLLKYRQGEQAWDILPNLILSLVMGVVVFFMQYLPLPSLLILIIQVITGAILYTLLSFITQNKGIRYCLDIITSMRTKKVRQC